MIQNGDDIQVERGNFTRIHNAILEQIVKAHFSSREYSAVLYLLRMTYGYQTTTAKLSGAQWEKGTGIKRQNIMATVSGLVGRNIILQDGGGRGRGNVATYKFNKHFDQWGAELNESPGMHFRGDEMNPQECISDRENESPSMQENESPSMQCTSDLKKERKLPAAVDDDPMALVRLAYQTVNKFGPPSTSEKGKAALAIACDLIEQYGFPACFRTMDKLRERNNAMIKANRQSISAPLPYLKILMEDAEIIPARAAAVVDFAYEEIAL